MPRAVADADQHDRQIARDAIAPEPRLSAPVADQHAGFRAAQRGGVDDRARQPAVDLSIRLAGVELPQQDLAVRPGQLEDAVGQARVGVFFRQRHGRLPRLGDAGDQVDPRRSRSAAGRRRGGCRPPGRAPDPRCPKAASSRPSRPGSARVRPRPMNFIRSVSNDASPIVVPWTVIRCIIHGGFSSADRGRRVQRIACRSRTNSVCTNRLLNAGCDRSWAGRARTTSA